ncbi:MAG: hypothetical protein ACQEQV_07060 [Fibrobacterota bacterium]
MVPHYLLIAFVLTAMTILFLVLITTLNSFERYITRIRFLLNTEYEFRREEAEVSRVLFESIKDDELENELDEELDEL